MSPLYNKWCHINNPCMSRGSGSSLNIVITHRDLLVLTQPMSAFAGPQATCGTRITYQLYPESFPYRIGGTKPRISRIYWPRNRTRTTNSDWDLQTLSAMAALKRIMHTFQRDISFRICRELGRRAGLGFSAGVSSLSAIDPRCQVCRWREGSGGRNSSHDEVARMDSRARPRLRRYVSG